MIGTGAAVGLVARREIVERVRERSLWISTGVTVAILAGILVLPNLLGFGGPTQGTVAALGPQAQRAGRRWRVELADTSRDPDGWVARVPSATVVDRRDGAVVVELSGGADEQALLDAARRAGRVRRFAPEEPTLAQLFREVVA